MPDGIKIAGAYIDIGLNRENFDKDYNNIKRESKNKVRDLEKEFAAIKMDFDDRHARMKLSRVKVLLEQYKKILEKKIDVGASDASIEKTRLAIESATNRLYKLGDESEKTTNKMSRGFKRVAGYLATAFGVRAMGRFIESSTLLYGRQSELESGFKGSARELERFTKATADALSRADLIKLSNQATDLGVSLEDQAVFFLLAKRAVSEYGGSVETNFQRIVTASEGELEGVKKVGIQQKIYQMRIRELAKEHGALIENLDAETQKRIRLKAILDSSGLSLQDVENKQNSFNEQLQAIPSLIVDIKTSFGGFFSKLLIDWLPNGIESLKNFNRKLRELTLGRGNVAAEGVTYDFTGTSEKDRAELIADWYTQIAVKISEASAAKTKFVKHEISYEEMEKLATDIDIAVSTYKRLIELARTYKKETDSETKIIKPYKDSQKEAFSYKDAQKLKERSIEEYYAKVKFADEGYFQWKSEQYIRDYNIAVAMGANKLQQMILLNQKFKELFAEQASFDKSSSGLKGKTPEDVYDSSEGRMNWRQKATRRREKEADELKRNTELAQMFSETLSSGLTQGIINGESFGKILANIGAQLAAMVVQALAFKGIMSLLGISGGASGGGGGVISSVLGFLGLKNGASSVINKGGSVSYTPHKKAAFGVKEFKVPGGFYRDNFMMGLMTNEVATVTPAGQVSMNDRTLTQISNRLNSVERAILQMDQNNMSKDGGLNIVQFTLNKRTLAIGVLKEMNRMKKSGYNLDDF